ncbi:hypothetical protein PG993_007103 [Apiospora rasikravindrae]|uniref:Uncharacterized protein n=1 Tax=Apiospora rasikravindrae TaxID=990691 RepID=A0ABR1SWW4_9PEZI
MATSYEEDPKWRKIVKGLSICWNCVLMRSLLAVACFFISASTTFTIVALLSLLAALGLAAYIKECISGRYLHSATQPSSPSTVATRLVMVPPPKILSVGTWTPTSFRNQDQRFDAQLHEGSASESPGSKHWRLRQEGVADDGKMPVLALGPLQLGLDPRPATRSASTP